MENEPELGISTGHPCAVAVTPVDPLTVFMLAAMVLALLAATVTVAVPMAPLMVTAPEVTPLPGAAVVMAAAPALPRQGTSGRVFWLLLGAGGGV